MEKSAYISTADKQGIASSVASTYIIWLDLLRLLAIIGVLFIHVSGPALYSSSPNSYSWWTAALYDSISRPAVPLFIMVSGALLLNTQKVETLTVFFKKRILKLVIPLLAWSFIYTFCIAFHSHQPFNLAAAIKLTIAGPVMYHLGFMYIIVGLYLITPIIQSYASNATLTNKLYFLGLWFFVNSMQMVFENFFHMHIGVQFSMVTGFVGYYLAGNIIYNYRIFEINKNTQKFLALIFVSMLMITMCGTYLLTIQKGGLNEFFYEYLSPNVVIMAFCIFVLVKNAGPALSELARKYPVLTIVLEYFRRITFGVYFAHVLVLGIFYSKLHFKLIPSMPLLEIPFLVVLSLLTTAGLVSFLRKVPLLKWLAP